MSDSSETDTSYFDASFPDDFLSSSSPSESLSALKSRKAKELLRSLNLDLTIPEGIINFSDF
jgi:hypothetical protein